MFAGQRASLNIQSVPLRLIDLSAALNLSAPYASPRPRDANPHAYCFIMWLHQDLECEAPGFKLSLVFDLVHPGPAEFMHEAWGHNERMPSDGRLTSMPGQGSIALPINCMGCCAAFCRTPAMHDERAASEQKLRIGHFSLERKHRKHRSITKML